MMKLKVIGSSSKGNSYLLGNNQEALILECGVKFDLIKQALDFDLNKVAGCLITHEHLDHAGSVKDVIYSGVDIYASKGTLEALKVVQSHRARILKEKVIYNIGSFRVLPFGVMHDATQPFGYFISHPDCGNVLFTTDTYYLPFTFKNLNNIIAEVNYDTEILNDNVLNGRIPQVVRNRVLSSHMSLDTFKGFLSANDLSQVNNIVMIHLSDGNSDAKKFIREVKDMTAKNVYVADSGLEIEFNKTPF